MASGRSVGRRSPAGRARSASPSRKKVKKKKSVQKAVEPKPKREPKLTLPPKPVHEPIAQPAAQLDAFDMTAAENETFAAVAIDEEADDFLRMEGLAGASLCDLRRFEQEVAAEVIVASNEELGGLVEALMIGPRASESFAHGSSMSKKPKDGESFHSRSMSFGGRKSLAGGSFSSSSSLARRGPSSGFEDKAKRLSEKHANMRAVSTAASEAELRRAAKAAIDALRPPRPVPTAVSDVEQARSPLISHDLLTISSRSPMM